MKMLLMVVYMLIPMQAIAEQAKSRVSKTGHKRANFSPRKWPFSFGKEGDAGSRYAG